MKDHSQASGRREFLQTLGGGALGLASAGRGYSAGTKPLRGVFPIGQTPVTESDKLDLECLQNEVKFCNRYKVHGFAWPQIASGWTTLSENERMDGADSIISLPPEKADDKAMMEYYKTIGQSTDLPMIVQTQGDISVDIVVEMAKQIPTMKCVKDEAGNPLARVSQIRERTNDKLAVFSGNGVRSMIDEMRLGFSGHCPTTVLSDFYAAAFDLWHAGKRR